MIALARTHTTDVSIDADKLSTQWPADGKLGLLRKLWILRQVPKSAFDVYYHDTFVDAGSFAVDF